jgi:DHA3 family macrolide efflux protein-like MFS transporter
VSPGPESSTIMPDGPDGVETVQAFGRPIQKSENLLATRDFGWLWWGQLVSQIGDGITRLALLWFVYSLTGSAIQTTIIGMLQTLPPIIFGPLIGVYLDRLPKKWIMIASDLLRAVIIGLIPCMIPMEALKVEYLFGLVFLNAIASTVFGPAMIASVPFIVSQSQFTAANALLQVTSSLGVIVGSAVSGYGIAALSSKAVLCVNAVTYVASAVCLLFVRIPHIPPARSGEKGELAVIMSDLSEGFRYAFVKQQIILELIIVAALYSCGMGAFATLFPIVGKNMLGLGSAEVGYLWSSLGIGLLAVSIGLVGMSDWHLRRRMYAIMVSSVITGIALCAMVGTSNKVVVGMLLCLIGAGVGLFTPVAWGVLQEIAPQRMVGRLLTVYGAAAMAAAMVGMTLFGWMVQKLGERPGVLGIGLMLFLTASMAGRISRRVGTY